MPAQAGEAAASGSDTPVAKNESPAVSNLNSVVASKNGTKYYFPWCGGLSRISPQNKVTFASSKEAEQAGYTIAANCPAP